MITIELSKFENSHVVTTEYLGEDIAVFKVNDKFYALNNICSHAQASLSEGEVYDCKVECPLHGAEFDLESGKALTLPATKPIKTYIVEIVESNLVIKDKEDA